MSESTGLPRPVGGPDQGRGAGDVDVHDGDGPPLPAASSAAPPVVPLPAAPTPAPDAPPPALAAGATTPPGHHRPRRRRWIATTAALAVLVLALAGATVHLYRTSTAWEARAEQYLGDARGLGGELASTREALAGTESELEGVRAQLATAQGRIVELADEKAQVGDDREVQRQLVDYQQRVSDAAGQVALALDQCVQGQQELIGYLRNTVTDAAQYDPVELERFRTDVEALCQTATEANIALQRELSR